MNYLAWISTVDLICVSLLKLNIYLETFIERRCEDQPYFSSENALGAEASATANRAAGANLSTSSFANQSQASTASAFMKIFGGTE